MSGLIVGVVGGLVGLAVTLYALRALTKAAGAGKMVGWGLLGLVGLAAAVFGVWYAAVGRKYGQAARVESRKATAEVQKAIDDFGRLLTQCRDVVFPKMPYQPSEQAKAEKYASAIRAMKEELLACYTGTKGTGNEKAAELDQIRWLVENKDCTAFARRLIHERTFCPQMIEALVDRGKFIDPLAAAEKGEKKPSAGEKAKVEQALARLEPKLSKCAKEVLGAYVAPKGRDPEAAAQAAVKAMMDAFRGCAAGKAGEELPAAAVEKLVGAADCEALAKALRGLEVCTPVLEAPLKAGWGFGAEPGSQGAEKGAPGGQAKPGAGKPVGTRPAARPAGQPRPSRAPARQ